MITSAWKKATASGGNECACVEVRRHDGMIEVRDTKDHAAGPTLRFDPAQWCAFINRTRQEEAAGLS